MPEDDAQSSNPWNFCLVKAEGDALDVACGIGIEADVAAADALVVRAVFFAFCLRLRDPLGSSAP
jgi:hypothetical protein